MARSTKRIGPISLAASQTVDTAVDFEIPEDGNFWVRVVVDGGTHTTVPTDAPLGSWQLWLQGDESVPYFRYVAAENGPNSLASLNPAGNVLINGVANFERMPARKGKIVYARTSGGATTARATLVIGKGR